MENAAVEAGEQRGGFVSDDGGFEVMAGEAADGFEGTPVGLNDYLHFGFKAAKGDGGAEVAGYAAEFGLDIFGKVFEIFGQLRFGGVGGPAAQDCARCRG